MTSRQVVPELRASDKYIREPFDCEKCRIEHAVSPYHIGPDENADCGRCMAMSSMKHPHVNPGCDVTVDPSPPIDDSFRSRKGNWEPNLSCFGTYERDICLRPECPVKVKCREYTNLKKESEQREGERG